MSDKKTKVIEVASRLFSEKGFDNTSINAICNEAGVSKGLVFHHFKNKNELLIAVFNQSANVISDFPKSNKTESSTKLFELIENFFDRLKHEQENFRFSINISIQLSSREILHDLITERSNSVQMYIQQLFEQLEVKDSKTKSFMFIAELDGIAINYLYAFDLYPIEEVRKDMITKYSQLIKN